MSIAFSGLTDTTEVYVQASSTVTGLHRWPAAPPARDYLRNSHRHQFLVTAAVSVTDTDRQVEFHDLQDAITAAVMSQGNLREGSGLLDLGPRSCEDIALDVLAAVPGATVVSVSEDGECEAIVRRRAGRPDAYFRGGTPSVVTVCGSTRFRDETLGAVRTLEEEGHLVLSVGSFPHADGVTLSPEVKERLDALHISKINASDFIYVVNPGGYIGESTRREIEHARSQGMPVVFLEPERVRDGRLAVC